MKALIFGFIFGLLASLIGLFVGLQVSPLLGNVLTFPLLAVSSMLNQPLGMMSGLNRLLAWIFAGLVWALVFYAAALLMRRLSNK